MADSPVAPPASERDVYVELGDARFFHRAGPFRLIDLAEAAGARLDARGVSPEAVFSGVAPLQTASADQVAVLHNPRYAAAAETTRAGAVIVGEAQAGRVAPGSAVLVAANPHLAWARVAARFHPMPGAVAGIHPSAVVDKDASVDPTAEIGPLAVVGARAVIGAGCQIGPGAVIGAGVVLGADCRVGANASVSHALVGARVYIYPGARVGQEGFGFAITGAGFVTVPQLGRVILEDDVEIGANSCVDRGASHDTVVGRGTRIDNLVQIGHNVRLGAACVIASQAGLSGSCVIGDQVQIGGQAGFAGHITVGSRAKVGGKAGVMSDVAPGADVVGSPALPVREFFRNMAVLRQMGRRKAAAATGG
jgi:UDP-3-O-[3-hydroxymyristoyl] glucosamine N-acyltransferase